MHMIRIVSEKVVKGLVDTSLRQLSPDELVAATQLELDIAQAAETLLTPQAGYPSSRLCPILFSCRSLSR